MRSFLTDLEFDIGDCLFPLIDHCIAFYELLGKLYSHFSFLIHLLFTFLPLLGGISISTSACQHRENITNKVRRSVLSIPNKSKRKEYRLVTSSQIAVANKANAGRIDGTSEHVAV